MINLRNLTKVYNEIIFEEVNLQVDNKINYLFGENGSGKSTLLNIISKNDNNYSGDIDYININNIVYLSQENMVLDELTFRENIELWTNDIDQVKLKNLLKIFNMEIKYNSKQKVSNFSGGEQKKVHIIIGLLRECDLLLIDEVDNHIDRNSIEQFVNFLQTLDCQIIISSHSLDEYMKEIEYTRLYIRDKSIIKEEQNSSQESQQVSKVTEKFSLNERKVNLLLKIGDSIKLWLVLLLIICSLFFTLFTFKFLVNIKDNINSSDTSLVFNDKSSLVYPPVFSSNFWELGNKSNLQTTPLFFTSQDLNRIKSLDYVKSVYPVMSKVSSVKTTTIEFDAKTVVHDTKPLGPQGVSYSFEQLTLPKEIITKIPVSYYTNFTKLTGEFPRDNSNEILIDENYASSLLSDLNLSDMNNLIGMTIDVPVEEMTTSDKSTIQLKVSGIYKANDVTSKEGIVYTAMDTDSEYYNDRVEYWDNFTYEDVEAQIDDVVEYVLDGDFSLYEDYYSQNETYYMGFYIEVEDASNIKDLTKEVNKYDPYIEVLNNYSIKHFPLFIYLRQSIFKALIGIVLIITIIAIINGILFKYYLGRSLKCINLLNFYNYNDEEVIKYKKLVELSFTKCIILALFVSFVLTVYFKGITDTSLIYVYLIIFAIYIISFITCLITNKIIRRREK